MKARLITKCGCTRVIEVNSEREVVHLAFIDDDLRYARQAQSTGIDWDRPVNVKERTFRRCREEDKFRFVPTPGTMYMWGEPLSLTREVTEAVFREV